VNGTARAGGPPATQGVSETFKISREAFDEIRAHARAARPRECCGLAGGGAAGVARAIYRLTNVARDPLTAYEAAPRELFEAQRAMRARGEELVAIYHSHPRSNDPSPSERDVRLAYYPQAVHLIVGFTQCGEEIVRAFRLYEAERRWERVEYEIREE
jgi:[CysO sulfur-carrier protein]-S-L-cysteine hydrolase